VAAAALFLAAKVEEQGRRVRDVINVIYRAEHASAAAYGLQNMQQTQQGGAQYAPQAYASPLHPGAGASGAAPAPRPPAPAPVVDDGCSLQVTPLFWELKEEVLRVEQHLLRVLGFGVRVAHPQQYVLHLARTLECSAELARLAFYIANDSARSSLCLQYPAATIAAGCIFVAAEMAQEQIRFHPQLLQSAAEQRGGGNATTGTGGFYTPQAYNSKAPSPYRSPHHPGAGGGGGGGGGSTAPSSNSSSYALTATTHSGEWWQYFGVQQMQLEDCAHQLLELYDEGAEDEPMMPYAEHGGAGMMESPLAQLQRIGLDVAAELRREAAQEAARQQRIEDSLKERNNASNSNSATAPATAPGSTPNRNAMRD